MKIKDFLQAFEGQDENQEVLILMEWEHMYPIDKVVTGYYFSDEGSGMSRADFEEEKDELTLGDEPKEECILIYAG